jgi:hydroxymethylpyrimidine pyrophosphatase-like HAD family hydrolase
MDVKLLALDLDGTVLRSDNTLSPVVGRALERAAASGIEVAVASGRPFGSMPREILSIDGVDYVIASNGAAIYHQHKRIFSDTLRPQDVQKILALTAGYLGLRLFGGTGMLLSAVLLCSLLKRDRA